jgi:hypothetical protein
MRALTCLDLKSAATVYPFLRTALFLGNSMFCFFHVNAINHLISHYVCFCRWATMMSTDKEQDGYSKILTRSDCERLRAQQKRQDVDQCEQFGQVLLFDYF